MRILLCRVRGRHLQRQTRCHRVHAVPRGQHERPWQLDVHLHARPRGQRQRRQLGLRAVRRRHVQPGREHVQWYDDRWGRAQRGSGREAHLFAYPRRPLHHRLQRGLLQRAGRGGMSHLRCRHVQPAAVAVVHPVPRAEQQRAGGRRMQVQRRLLGEEWHGRPRVRAVPGRHQEPRRHPVRGVPGQHLQPRRQWRLPGLPARQR